MAEKKPASKADIDKACVEPDPATEGYFYQQTMYRIKDPVKSMEFYTGVLGMRLLKQFDMESMQFSNYFFGYEKASDIPADDKERTKWMFSRKACLELTHNWGTENDPEQHYHNGNSDPRGYGHIGIVVPDLDKACERMEKMNVKFIKKPSEGKMRGLAFIQDPDGYWLEIMASDLADKI